MTQRDTICIMADFGMGPYAWRRPADQVPPYVGGNIADAVAGFPEDMGVPKELETEFAEWVTLFERDYDQEGFDWDAWNKRGLELTRKLKDFLGDAYAVEYHYPVECPHIPERGKWVVIG